MWNTGCHTVPFTSTFDLDLWPWIFKVKWYLGNGRPDCHGKWDGSGYDALMWNIKEMSQLDTALTGVPLNFTFYLELSRSNCISWIGGPIVMERRIGCPYGFRLPDLVHILSSLLIMNITEMIGISLRIVLRCFRYLMFLLCWEIKNSWFLMWNTKH